MAYLIRDAYVVEKFYSNLAEASLGINSGSFITEENIASNALYLGSIITTRNATDLNNILQSIFVPSSGTTINGSVASPPLGYTAESESNKQSTLVPDSTGVKYPSISALQAQAEITTTSSLSNSTMGKYIFFNPSTDINITITAADLYSKHIIHFVNESAYTITFVAGSSTVFNSTGKAFVLNTGGSGHIVRKGATNKFFINIENP